MSAQVESLDQDPLSTPDYPELGTGPIPVDPYVSAEYFHDEIRAVFAPSWMLACLESDIPLPGDYIVKSVPALKASILIVRGQDGAIRGFHNACRHRGNQLVHSACRGHADKGFVCGFHSWTFGLDGRCMGVTDRSRFFDLDRGSLSLTPVSVETVNHLVFYCPGGQARQSLAAYLGTMGDVLSGCEFDGLVLRAEWSVTIDANWKVFQDAFMEGYHVGTVHKRTAPSLYNGADNPFCRHKYAKLHGLHRQSTVPLNPNATLSPTEVMTRQMMATAARTGGARMRHKGLNLGKVPNYAFDINGIYPNTLIDPTNSGLFTMEFVPVSVNRTNYVVRFYMSEAKTWSERIAQEFLGTIQLREALMEDLSTMEATQRGLESGALKNIIFSDQEILLRHSHHVVDSAVRQYRETMK